jgi:hypothetical protein
MTSAQLGDIIRLGSFVIPIIILLIAGQVVRFDPNRRLSRPSVCKAAIKGREQPWGWILQTVRVILVALLVVDLAQIGLTSLGDSSLLAWAPAWAIFQNPNGSAIYVSLALLATWFVGRLKRTSMDIFDQVFESHLDFNDWRTADYTRDSRPALHLGNWRYQMKWNFKTNPEPIDALHMRMIIDCHDFAEFERRIKAGEYPGGFEKILKYSPYGRILGDTRSLMEHDMLHRIYRAPSLFAIWENQPNPYANGALITSDTEMASMLYTELRGLILCAECRAHPEKVAACAECGGTGARLFRCADCGGSGINAKKKSCEQCGGLGLRHTLVPGAFMNRLQYLWMGRNVDLMKNLFPVWLSNLTYASVLAVATALFLGASLLFGGALNVDLLAQSLLFGEAVLLGMLSGAIVFVFAVAFNGSGMLIASYPLRETKFGNHVFSQLMNLLGWLTFGSLLIDTTFVMSQFLFVHNINVAALALAASTVTAFVIVISFGGFYSIHTAMRDTKQSRLDELSEWLHHPQRRDTTLDTDQEEEFFKELRDLQEWPIDLNVGLGIVSGILIPVALSLGSVLTGPLSSLFHGL